MSRTRENRNWDPSRWIAIYFYAAILVRQQEPDGEIRCGYCRIPLAVRDEFAGVPRLEWDDYLEQEVEVWDLVRAGRNLDHADGNDRNNREDNLLASCFACNIAIGRHDKRGKERLAERLAELGIREYDAERRVNKILRTPLPDRRSDSVVALAMEWFGDRIQYQRDIAAKRAGREPARRSSGDRFDVF